MKVLLLLGVVLLSSATTLPGQSVEIYTATVVTLDGQRARGLLKEVSETTIIIGDYTDAPSGLDDVIALSGIRKVVLRRTNQRRATIRGAVAGGIVIGLLTVESSRKSGFRSPVVYGITLASAIVGGALAGALAGNGIRSLFKKTVRPRTRNTTYESNQNLRRELEPYTFLYQQTILDRVYTQPQP